MEQLIGQGSAPADVIKESSTASFVTDVIEASNEVPVVVDFWAPWCEPCKQLGPQLEKVVTGAGGKVRLVKINIDENPEIAQQLKIQSIPAVFAFRGGQPVDGFIGAQPESQIKSFIERLTGPIGPSPVEQALEQAKAAIDEGDFQAASNIYAQILKQQPGEATAIGGLARCFVALGQLDQARDILQSVDDTVGKHPDVEGARAALALAEQAADTGDTAALERDLAADPNDHQARYDIAMAHYAAGRNEDAIDGLLEVVRRDRQWNDDGARAQLLKIFEALGPTDAQTVAGRRKLSSILFA